MDVVGTMKVKFSAFWEKLSGSFWFLPAVMVLASIILAAVMLTIDGSESDFSTAPLSWTHAGSPEGARAVLSTIAASMISVAGVAFSITIATLSLASSQLGPRLLSNFMRDRGNQIVLGTFVSIFTYCLLVLRFIRSSDDIQFVPHFSVTLALALAIISLGVLIYFFHHVSSMIQAQNLIAQIGTELETSIERLFSRQSERSPYEYELRQEADIPDDLEANLASITARSSGYLQAVDYEILTKTAINEDLLLQMQYRPGDFVAKGSELVAVYPAERQTEDVEKAVHNAVTLGAGRLRIQDVEYVIEQLVEIAVRALSPGINDPFTVIACLDQFSTTLADLAERTIPSGYYYDSDGHLRVISDAVTFKGLIDAAFNQIRQHGQSDVAVTIRLLEVIAIIIARAKTDEQREALVRQAEMIMRTSNKIIPEPNDRQDIADRYQLVMRILNGDEDSP